jgi:hypothetical protein
MFIPIRNTAFNRPWKGKYNAVIFLEEMSVKKSETN